MYQAPATIKAIIAEQRMTFADVSNNGLTDVAKIIDYFDISYIVPTPIRRSRKASLSSAT